MTHLHDTIIGVLIAASMLSAQSVTLPSPVKNGNSFEVLSNSRYSVHTGFTATLSTQIAANILWAMNRAPHLGSFREFYVAMPTNLYQWDSVSNTLNVFLSGNHRYNANTSFEIGIACGRWEEAGFAIQAGLLASIAFWTASSKSLICCPQDFATVYADTNWKTTHPVTMTAVFGGGTATGLVTTVQAKSSDSSLTAPLTSRPDTFEVVLGNLKQDSVFNPAGLSKAAISQLLWAGYGVTPHSPSGDQGLTVPSAYASYYLTRRIYLVRDSAVFRYNNRTPPGTSLTTSDHRLELVMTGDRRPQLRTAITRVPSTAPDYIVICVGDTSVYGPMVESGLVGFQLLMQARSLGLGGRLTAPLTITERTAIIAALGTPATDLPAIVFSCGAPLTTPVLPVRKAPTAGDFGMRIQTMGKAGVRIDYHLNRSAQPVFIIYTLSGVPVRSIRGAQLLAGRYSVTWNGAMDNGMPVRDGIYCCRFIAGGEIANVKIQLVR